MALRRKWKMKNELENLKVSSVVHRLPSQRLTIFAAYVMSIKHIRQAGNFF